jgi:uncharacterized protein involved in outer membrane biogenesis
MGVVVKKARTTMMPKILGVPVSMKTCDLSLLGGGVLIEDLVIGNPKGFKQPHSFKLSKMDIKLDVFSLLSDKVIVDKIIIDGMNMTHEGITDSNLLKIKSNIKCYIDARRGTTSTTPSEVTDSTEPKQSTPSTSQKGFDKKIVIKVIKLKNISVAMYSDLTEKSLATVKLGDIEIDNVGTGNGKNETLADVLYDILPTILTQIAKTDINVDGAKEVIKDLKKKYNKETLKNIDEKDIDKGVDALKSLF